MNTQELLILSTIQPRERIEYTPKWSRETRVYSVEDVQGEPKIKVSYYNRKEYEAEKKGLL